WQVDQTLLLSHPGCLLSCYRSYDTMLDRIAEAVETQPVTVLVTHWWEYFRNNTSNDRFIEVLHQTAAYLASRNDVKVISFAELAKSKPALH
ncbi:MAG: hypothetical protein K0Q55_2638, partial [Verrucomicrobia bacterium]|nr:hypothetical protein [Verrucomicrobiota bacterium]